jgi:hypothetical protein
MDDFPIERKDLIPPILGGCSWGAFAHTGSRNESLYCYHRLLEEHGREP